MNIDDIPDQLEALLDRARALLDQQITKARKVVDNLNAEKTALAKALAELKDQHEQAKAELDSIRANLNRAWSLVGLDGEIAKARTELEQLKAENAKVATALEASTKKQAAAEAQVTALQNDARLATAERARAQEMVAQIKKQFGA